MSERFSRPRRRRTAGDPRATVQQASEYLEAVRRRKVSDRPLSVLQREAAELRRMLGRVLAVTDDVYLTPRSLPEEQAQARAALLAEVPASERAVVPEGDQASAVAFVLAARGDDVAGIVAGWLRAARREGTGLSREDVRTVLDALDVAADELRSRASVCPDCDDESCETCLSRHDRAEAYDRVAATLAGVSR